LRYALVPSGGGSGDGRPAARRVTNGSSGSGGTWYVEGELICLDE